MQLPSHTSNRAMRFNTRGIGIYEQILFSMRVSAIEIGCPELDKVSSGEWQTISGDREEGPSRKQPDSSSRHSGLFLRCRVRTACRCSFSANLTEFSYRGLGICHALDWRRAVAPRRPFKRDTHDTLGCKGRQVSYPHSGIPATQPPPGRRKGGLLLVDQVAGGCQTEASQKPVPLFSFLV